MKRETLSQADKVHTACKGKQNHMHKFNSLTEIKEWKNNIQTEKRMLLNSSSFISASKVLWDIWMKRYTINAKYYCLRVTKLYVSSKTMECNQIQDIATKRYLSECISNLKLPSKFLNLSWVYIACNSLKMSKGCFDFSWVYQSNSKRNLLSHISPHIF